MKTSSLFFTPIFQKQVARRPEFAGRDYETCPRRRRMAFLRDIRRFVPFETRQAIIKEMRSAHQSFGSMAFR